LFSRLGSVQERRQILRWLGHDYERANADIVKVLRTALADPDWEIRVTAMLVAARLGARELALDVRRMALPQTSREGLDREDRGLLLALRKAVLAQLGGEPLPAAHVVPASGPQRKAAMWAQLRRCVAGAPSSEDQIWLWVQALVTPLSLPEEHPRQLPAGIVRRDARFYLAVSGLELCWVAPVEHWLGSADLDLPMPNPIRRRQPEAGFFVATAPVDMACWSQVMAVPAPAVAGPARCEWSEAVAFCTRLAEREGVKVRLPDADAWEMAIRGPDGRRHPWGNGFEADWQQQCSPWGLQHSLPLPQWGQTDGAAIFCGADRRLRCAARTTPEATDARAAVRPMVLLA
jgi:hypothetical protein